MLSALSAAISSGATSYTIAPGVYRIPGNEGALGGRTVKLPTNFVLSGAGAEIITPGTAAPVFWANSTNVSIMGAPGNPLIFEADPLPFSQGQVVAFNTSTGVATIQVMTGYAMPAAGASVTPWGYDASGNWVGGPAYPGSYTATLVDSMHFTLPVGTSKATRFAVGNYVVWNFGGGFAFETIGIAGMTIQDVSTYSSGGVWGGGGNSGAWKFIRWMSGRRPGTNRLNGGGGGQQFSTTGPGSSVFWEGCEIGFSNDDTIDFLSGGLCMAYQQTASNSVILYGSGSAVGDTLRFISYPSLEIQAQGVVVSTVKLTDTNTEAAAKSLEESQLNFNDNRSGIWQVTLDRNVTVNPAALVDDISHRCQSLTMQNCYLHDGATRVMLQGVVNGTIQNNVFERINRTLYLTSDLWWWEGGQWDNVNVLNNVFNQCPYQSGDYAVKFGPSSYGTSTGTSWFGGATISGNSLIGGAGTAIFTNNAGGPLNITDNEILNPGGTAITLNPVRGATVEGNVISASPVQTAIGINNSANSTINGNTINAIPASLNTATMIAVTGTQSNVTVANNSASHGNGGQFECEYCEVPAYSGPTVPRVMYDNACSNGAAMIIDATAVGNSMTLLVENVVAATYNVKIGLKDANTRGIFQLAIGRADNFNGTKANLGSPVDEYSANPSYPVVDLGNWTPGTTSDKWFQFTVTGKNAASGGYGVSIDYILLTPQ